MGKMLEFTPQEQKKASIIPSKDVLFKSGSVPWINQKTASTFLDHIDGFMMDCLENADLHDVVFAAERGTAINLFQGLKSPDGGFLLYYGKTERKWNYIACAHVFSDGDVHCGLYRFSKQDEYAIFDFTDRIWSDNEKFQQVAKLISSRTAEAELAGILSRYAGMFLLEMDPDVILSALEDNKILIDLRKKTWPYSRFCVSGDTEKVIVGLAPANTHICGCMVWASALDGGSYCLGQVLPANKVTMEAKYKISPDEDFDAKKFMEKVGDVLVPIWYTTDSKEMANVARIMWDHYPTKTDTLQLPLSDRAYAETTNIESGKYIVHVRSGGPDMTDKENEAFKFAVLAFNENANNPAQNPPTA